MTPMTPTSKCECFCHETPGMGHVEPSYCKCEEPTPTTDSKNSSEKCECPNSNPYPWKTPVCSKCGIPTQNTTDNNNIHIVDCADEKVVLTVVSETDWEEEFDSMFDWPEQVKSAELLRCQVMYGFQPKSADHWLEVQDHDGWYSAIVKWDGCVHYTRYSNEPLSTDVDNQDYLHICDIQGEIDRLYGLLRVAREHFKDNHYYETAFAKEPKATQHTKE